MARTGCVRVGTYPGSDPDSLSAPSVKLTEYIDSQIEEVRERARFYYAGSDTPIMYVNTLAYLGNRWSDWE